MTETKHTSSQQLWPSFTEGIALTGSSVLKKIADWVLWSSDIFQEGVHEFIQLNQLTCCLDFYKSSTFKITEKVNKYWTERNLQTIHLGIKGRNERVANPMNRSKLKCPSTKTLMNLIAVDVSVTIAYFSDALSPGCTAQIPRRNLLWL